MSNKVYTLQARRQVFCSRSGECRLVHRSGPKSGSQIVLVMKIVVS